MTRRLHSLGLSPALAPVATKRIVSKALVLTVLLLSMAMPAESQDREVKWEVGGGGRLNYLGLSGGVTGFNAETDAEYDLDYHDIGMDKYSPSLSLALGGRYKKWNLSFGASRGTYSGTFITQNDIDRDTIHIPAGSEVESQIKMGIYSLATTFAVVRRKHDLGVGLGFLVLNMGTRFETTDVLLENNNWFPMPFLAVSGRLNFDRFRVSAVGGGAYFDGEKDDYDYTVWYYTFDVKGVYDFYRKDNWAASVSLGYRQMVMDSEAAKGESWFKEKDNYKGPFLSLRVKYTRFLDELL